MPSLRARVAAIVVAVSPLLAGAADSRGERLEDFAAFERAIQSSYAYPEALAAWRRSIPRWRARAAAARDEASFIAALEGAIDALHDDNVTLSRRTPRSPRRVPEESDLWARYVGGEARIEAVRISSEADAAGVQPGERVARIEGVDVSRAVDARLGDGARESGDRDWALRHLLAGPRRGDFTIELEPGARSVRIERRTAKAAEPAALARRIGESRDIAYVRLRFGSRPAVALQLDEAFAALAGTRAFILDLRDCAGPATRAEMQAVLARFARAGGPWQVRIARDGRRMEDRVPAAQGARGVPLVVLVDRWTHGDAESLAMGLRAIAGATLIGTPMAQLHGVTATVRLPHSGVVLRLPVERALAPDATPREAIAPDIAVDLARPSGGPGDPILYRALKHLERDARR